MPETLTDEKRKKLATKIHTVSVSAFELAFILEMRKHNFGRITAVIVGGIPSRVEISQSIQLLESKESQEALMQEIDIKEILHG